MLEQRVSIDPERFSPLDGSSRKNGKEVARIRQIGRHLGTLFEALSRRMKPGISGVEIDTFVAEYLKERGLTPALRGYDGFPATCCVSPGSIAVHGVPTDKPIPAGELVTVDVGVERDGWYADAAWTFAIGPISREYARLLKGAYAACLAGVAVARAGNSYRSLARTVAGVADRYGLSLIAECCGHGIGRRLHEFPVVPYRFPRREANISRAHIDRHFEVGQVLTVEPVLSLVHQTLITGEGISGLRGSENRPTAQFEHTVVVGRETGHTLTVPAGPSVDFPPYF